MKYAMIIEYCAKDKSRLVLFQRDEQGVYNVIEIIETQGGTRDDQLTRALRCVAPCVPDMNDVAVRDCDDEWVMPDCLTLRECLKASARKTY